MERKQTQLEKYQLQLKDCELIQKMDLKSLESFLSLFHEERWPKSSCIINQENLSYHFYIILSGRIKMYKVDSNIGKELTLFLLTKNNIFDLNSLLDGSRHDVYYECIDNAKVLAAPMEDVKKWLKDNPEHYQNILPCAGKQLLQLENFISNIIFNDVSTRLLQLILKNVNPKSQDLELINDLPNKEIANLIGSTRAMVNRHLQKLKQLGTIKLSRKRMEIKNLKMLIRLLEEKKNHK
jgi:CRP/FNR family cyclic AMP-dependent transcriptional regulator